MRKENPEIKQRVYAYIVDYIDMNGYPPSLNEIGAEMGHHYSTSRYYVQRLITEGKIKKGPGCFRNLQIV